MDSEAVMQYVLASEDLNNQDIYVFGRSLGGAVAIHLAAKHPEKVRYDTIGLCAGMPFKKERRKGAENYQHVAQQTKKQLQKTDLAEQQMSRSAE